ncbi:DUF4336 domain-containing protein [Frigidibacter sp. ROC022]|uniref:DUF4336 domain-containing protein n=1 Tax=Frigidibacter sp. ROC022 TaxID=2971796 RepID=UPI00215A390C|nr:DUF4336 domain-containing protein [Frigidibacter sp. ROC022]MCR8724171.1 DUF4336 domain-containing protein [Frigidibacter sp. ROC022]
MSLLTPVAADIWIIEGGIVNFYGFPYPTRSVLVRLPDGALWVWSPVALSPALRAEVETLGTPAHLVSPNRIHHLYLQDWKTAFPGARLWGPLSTIRKRCDLSFEPPLEETSPAAWQGAFDQVWFRGSRLLDEIVFLHRASRTVIIADMSENFSDRFLRAHWSGWKRVVARLWGIVEGKGYAPLELRLTSFARASLRASRDRMLAWDPRRVIMAHGEWQRQDGRRYLERAFAWIGGPG